MAVLAHEKEATGPIDKAGLSTCIQKYRKRIEKGGFRDESSPGTELRLGLHQRRQTAWIEHQKDRTKQP